MSPVQLLIAFIHGGIHPLTNRLPHTWYGEQVKCFLNSRPVFLGHQDGFVSLTHDDDWLVGFGSLVDQPIKVAARLSRCDPSHDAPLACLTFDQVYAFRYVRQDERRVTSQRKVCSDMGPRILIRRTVAKAALFFSNAAELLCNVEGGIISKPKSGAWCSGA